MRFEMLGSLSTREVTDPPSNHTMEWDNVWGTWVYVLMPPQHDLASFQQSLNALSEREDKTVKNTHIELAAQPLTKIMFGNGLGNEIGPTMGTTLIWVFSGLSFVVILSACFNYTNLSIARSLRRSREVGVRKVMGAFKSQVVTQFVVEAVIISLAALTFAILLFIFIKPHFIAIGPGLGDILHLTLSPMLVLLFVLFAITIGVLAGIFPSLFFAKMNAVSVLKNSGGVRIFKKMTMRKVLIVFQYSLSLMLIMGTLILYKQYKHFLNYDLGFSTENILNIRLQGNKADLLKKSLGELPEVERISESKLITSIGAYWSTNMRNPNNPEDSVTVWFNSIDENYLPLHEHTLVAGQNFTSKADSVAESEVIVNEYVLQRFELARQNPADALGQVVKIDGKDMRIIGVLKNFEYGRANNNNNREVILRYTTEEPSYLNVKIHSTDLLATYAKIESIWKKADSVHPLDAKFYDEQIQDAFRGFSASMKIAGTIAFLAICIASMGLLGMVVFTTETKLKEVSIRKVLGASEGRLLLLLGKGFIILIGVASLIALPLTYLFFEQILFPTIANHAPIGLVEMLAGVVAVVVMALIMITSQTLKAAKANPAEVLKAE